MPTKWIEFEKIMAVVQKAREGAWDWGRNPQCKYIDVRLDMRDGHCIISDRDGTPITLEELEYQQQWEGEE